MLSKAEKKRLKKLNDERVSAGERPYVPAKPRQRFASEISAVKRSESNISAFRPRKEIHPVDKLWLSKPPKLTLDEYNAAITFRLLYEKRESTGVDSTQALLAVGGGSSNKAGWTDAQTDAHSSITQISRALPAWEFEIVRKVCGQSWPLPDAVHAHSICHRDGVLQMFKNTLKHLKEAIAGADVPWHFLQSANDYRKQVVEKRA